MLKKTYGVFSFLFLVSAFLAAIVSCSERKEKPSPSASAGKEANREGLPHVIPYLDSKPSAIDGQGTAAIHPSGPLPASSSADFDIRFTVGEAGIAPSGFIMLQVSPWWGWSPLQSRFADQPGYVTVRAPAPDYPLRAYVLPLNRLVIQSPGGFKAGEAFSFIYKDAQVDRFAEAEELFQIFTDADGDGNSACIQKPPSIQITAREPVRLEVTAPTQATPGKPIEVRAAPLDELGNWSRFPAEECRLKVTRDGQETAQASRKAGGGEKSLSFSYTPGEEGAYFFTIQTAGGLQGKSNVTLCQKGEPHLKLFFGDIHGHSRMSDGSGTPEDYYRYAREVSGLDIAALTDHADYGTIPMKGAAWERIKQATNFAPVAARRAVPGSAWERIKQAANDAYQPGRFVTFLAFEWTNWKYGHRNVYYRDGDGPIFRSIDPESDTPQKLWKLLEPYEAMTIAHHVGGGPVATDWSIPPGPKERLVEISSIHGTSEFYGGDAAVYHPVEGAFVKDALARGYKLGIIGSGDTHDGHPGQRSAGALVTGKMGVYAKELTREAIWEAMKKRQVYATSGPKIILNFRAGDAPMGSEVAWEKTKGPLPLAVRAVCCEEIESVEIIRNGEPVFRQEGDGVAAQYLLDDPEPPAGASYYYLRVKQTDGNLAWSSPIWVTMK